MLVRGFVGSTAGILACAILLFDCANPKAKPAAEKAVVVFHDQLDRGEFAKIYADTHPDFKKQTAERDFVAILDAVHRKLGNTVSADPAGWQVKSFNLQTNVQLTYQTKFSGGDAVESFNYRVEGGNAVLLGYNINSQALITK